MEPDRVASLEKIHFRGLKLGELPVEERRAQLNKRVRSRYFQLVVNVLAILFFTYSWYFDITRLEGVFIAILGVVFVLNTGLIGVQFRQLKSLREHYGLDS